MSTIARHCDHCKKFGEVNAEPFSSLNCPHCKDFWGRIETIDKIFDRCPICTCRQFYLQKNFNQALGCFIMLFGIILVPKTYGLSLPAFALIDWLLYKYIPTIIVCYRCGTAFQGFSAPPNIKPFIHQIGLKYDRYRK